MVPVQTEFYALEGLTQLQRIVDLVQKEPQSDVADLKSDSDDV